MTILKKILFVFSLLVICLQALAQQDSWSLEGVVKDNDGYPLPWAAVTPLKPGSRHLLPPLSAGVAKSGTSPATCLP